MTPIIDFFKEGTLPKDPTKARRLRNQCVRHYVIDGRLYRKSYKSGVDLRCVTKAQGDYILNELLEGSYGNHPGGRILAYRVTTTGYWWPNVRKDSEDFSRKCKVCQRFYRIRRVRGEPLHTMIAPWPFARWGMDMVGELPRGTGGRRFALLATDYYTKWVIARSYAKLRGEDVVKFIWENIITVFGIPNEIIADNGVQFRNRQMFDFYDEYGIELRLISVYHAHGNGQAKASNKVIFDGIKKTLQGAKGK